MRLVTVEIKDESLETCPPEQIEYLIAQELGAIKRHLMAISEALAVIAGVLGGRD